MNPEQLDIFREAEKKLKENNDSAKRTLCEGIVVPFPIDRQVRHIRETARQLERRHGPAADKFWRTECNRLYGRLQVQGLDDGAIRAEVDRFALAVHAEMQRAAWAAWHRDHDGDAA